MIPLRDSSLHKNFTLVNTIIIVLNVWIFLNITDTPLGPLVLFKYGLIPKVALLEAKRRFITGDFSFFVPMFSYMFIHGGALHLLGNIWFLWVFGQKIEERLGSFRYFIFYILCGMISGNFHIVFNPSSVTPCIGASGAISGVIGAYLILYPEAKILTLIPFFPFPIIKEIPAFVFIIIWLFLQISGAVSGASIQGGTGVAWWAHFGGFIWGLFTVLLFKKDTLEISVID